MKSLWQRFLRFYKKYSYAQVLWIGIIYPIWFKSIESRVTVATGYHIMHTKIDEMIPFCEYFIVPYYMWFIYIFLGVLYFLFTNKEDFYKVCLYLFIGMIFSLLICEIYPNGTDLRPPYTKDQNIFQILVAGLYSIHAYNSICMHVAIMKSKDIQKLSYGKVIRRGSFFLCIFICIATLVLKQHSVLDVGGAILLAFIVYGFVYGYPGFSLWKYLEKKYPCLLQEE